MPFVPSSATPSVAPSVAPPASTGPGTDTTAQAQPSQQSYDKKVDEIRQLLTCLLDDIDESDPHDKPMESVAKAAPTSSDPINILQIDERDPDDLVARVLKQMNQEDKHAETADRGSIYDNIFG